MQQLTTQQTAQGGPLNDNLNTIKWSEIENVLRTYRVNFKPKVKKTKAQHVFFEMSIGPDTFGKIWWASDTDKSWGNEVRVIVKMYFKIPGYNQSGQLHVGR